MIQLPSNPQAGVCNNLTILLMMLISKLYNLYILRI